MRRPTARPSSSTEELRPIPSGLHFLLAEDGAVNQAVFMGLLASRGHEVSAVEDGQQAIDAWRKGKFDAIFMDVQMPLLDGLEATRMIREQEQTLGGSRIPIIAITAGALDSDQEQCFAAGMDEYLTKPIDVEELDRILAQLHPGAPSETATPASADATDNPPTRHSDSINLSTPLARLKCSAEQHRQLVSTLGQELRQRLNEISQALETHSDKLLVRASHSLKSAAALFEANRVVNIAAAIEQHARAGASAHARSRFPELREATAEILVVIDQWLNEP